MKTIILGALLPLLSINASAGSMYAYKGADGQVVMTNTNPSDTDAVKPFKHTYQIERENKYHADVAYKKQLAAKPSAAIGMSKAQVLNSTNWGKPKSVNTTTNAYGTQEQWIYSDYQYLYFDNGKLSTIQQ